MPGASAGPRASAAVCGGGPVRPLALQRGPCAGQVRPHAAGAPGCAAAPAARHL